MIQSQPILVEGRMLGVAVGHPAGCHFVAADPVVDDLHGEVFASPAEAARIAALVLARARSLPPAGPLVLRQPPILRRLS